jgi:hypothetical protein
MLHALPVAGTRISAVAVENSVYAFGGYDRGHLRAVQKLSLDSLTWELMQLKLPQAASWFPCFKVETQVYLVIEITLYSFTPLQLKKVKTLPLATECETCKASYYSRGSLYYETGEAIGRLAVGMFSGL